MKNRSFWAANKVVLSIVFVLLGALFLLQYEMFKTFAKGLEQIETKFVTLQADDADPAQLEKAVSVAIENIESEKMKKNIASKLAAYTNAQEQVAGGKHIYGSQNARFTLVEFSDLECPYCKRFHNTPKQLVDESNGNVNWEWMHLPLSFHNPAAQYGAEASECVADLNGNRSFWAYISEYYDHTRGNGQGAQDLALLAANIGVDQDAFRRCMTEGRYRSKVQEDANKAASLGVSGTPATFLVDNLTGKSQMLGGAQPAEAFVGVMRKMIAEEQESQK